MDRDQVKYLSYITVADNIPSILKHGILSHENAEEIDHVSVANVEVQERRAAKILPSGEPLHSYANLYFWARNAMMYRVRDREGLCVIRVSADVLDIDGTYYSNRNASTYEARFFVCEHHFDHLDARELYAGSWATDGETDHERMQCMQAEVLVPDRVPPKYIEGVYVRTREEAAALRARFRGLDVKVRRGLFFDE